MEKNYKIAVDLYKKSGEPKELRKAFYSNDYPVPYKDLTFYPLTLELFQFVSFFLKTLIQPHRSTGKAEAISRNYLSYMYYLFQNGEEEYLYGITQILLIALKKEDTYVDENGEVQETITVNLDNKGRAYLWIEKTKITGEEFDDIREIICEQNGVEMLDETLHPDFVKAKQAYDKALASKNKIELCGIEDQINYLVLKSAYSREEIIKMTVRSFFRIIERSIKITEYTIHSLLSPHMTSEDRKRIGHPLEVLDRDKKNKESKYFQDFDTFKEKNRL